MEKYYGNHLGICINNIDPENRGRVQVFVPHIMPALYEGWNELGEDIKLECVGNNLPNGLSSKVVEKLTKILPWCEAAMPVIGNSVAGSYNPQTGNFNQTNTPEALAYMDGADLYSNNFVDFIKSSEGFSEKAYDDSGQFSIGYGTKATSSTETITREEAENRLRLELNDAAQQTNSLLSNKGVTSLTQSQKEALISYTYNRGPGGLKQLLNNSGKTWDSIEPNILKYWGSNESVKQGLINRRQKELNYANTTVININNPATAPDPSAAGASDGPFKRPEPWLLQSEPTQDATTQITPPTPVSVGTSKGNLQAALTAASRNVGGVGFVTGSFPGKCARATRGLANVTLGVGNHFPALSERGIISAKQTIGINYWERPYTDPKTGQKGSLYERISTNNYVAQEGDIGITTGGDHGHAKMVVGGRFRSDRIDDSAANLAGSSTAAVYRLTSFGQELYKKAGLGDSTALGQPVPDMPSDATPDGTGTAGDDASTQIVKNTTETTATPLDTTGMPQGMFGIPGPGAMLWVFFREGDPMFPVYFAASYGAAEWQSAYKASSPAAYGPQENNSNSISNQAVFRPNNAGALTFTGAVNSEQDSRAVRIAHANGGYLEFHPYGSVHYSPNEHLNHVGGTNYNYCINREEWTQGDDNKVVIGNQWVVVGNPSQANIETIEKLTEKVKQINAEMMKN
jgi:GH24 family phage-related lysozyme (muramidase)